MKMGFFNRGIEATQKLADAHKASFSSNGIYDFYVKDGQEALMRFLTDEPVSFMAHNIKVGKAPRTFVCTGDADCQGCKQADSFDPTKPNKPVVRAAYLVLDGTITEKDEMQDGKPTGKKVQYTDQIKVMVRGTSDIAAIERCKEKYGLLGRAYYVSKMVKRILMLLTVQMVAHMVKMKSFGDSMNFLLRLLKSLLRSFQKSTEIWRVKKVASIM